VKFKRFAAAVGAFSLALAVGAAHADGWTDLRGAIYWNQEAEVARLLDGGADINMRNSEGWTPLHVAAEQGMVRMVRYLLARGADANARTNTGRTPYDVASGYAEVQALLKAKMASPTDPFAAHLGAGGPQSQAPAPQGGYSERSRNGPNDGRTASTRPRLEARDAVWYNNKAELEAILNEGLDVNALDETSRETLLHAAAWRDRVDIARMLLARGANPAIRDKDGKSPADYAQSPEMRALLGQGRASPRPTGQPNASDHCKRMWQEATALCGIGATSCNTSAHIRYQSCQQKGVWY
jgi:hypothetical protein